MTGYQILIVPDKPMALYCASCEDREPGKELNMQKYIASLQFAECAKEDKVASCFDL